MPGEMRKASFLYCAGPVKLVQACVSARKDRESNFHDCGGAVKLMQAYLNIRKDREIGFHQCVCDE